MKKLVRHILVCSLFLGAVFSVLICSKDSHGATMKIKYSGKTRNYAGIQVKSSLDGKSLTARKTKGIIIKGTRMVSYYDVFKTGLKATCSYKASKKQLTIKKNGVTVKLYIGKKYAYVNGKKKKLSTAPLQVYYVKSKKTKILVPCQFVATSLKYSYKWSNKTTQLTSPFSLYYDGAKQYYTKTKGNLIYNGISHSLSSMPAMSIGGGYLVPAKETFQTIIGLKYSFDSATNGITIEDAEHSIKIEMVLNSNEIKVNGVSYTSKLVPKKIKRMDTKKWVVCVPASFVSNKLNLYYAWDKATSNVKIHTKTYFSWNAKSVQYDSTKYSNAIASVSSNYDNANSIINIAATGTSSEIMKTASVVRNDKVITVTFPTTKYDFSESMFNQYGELIESMSIKQDSTNTIMTITGLAELDYAYSINDAVFTLQIVGEASNNYQLKIPKPAGVTFDMVTNTDLYNSNKFYINISGDHVAFFNANPIVINSDKITSVTVTNVSGNTRITVTTSALQGYKIFDKSSNFSVKVGTPKSIFNKIVVLDAGHGGHDPGAVANSTNEKDFNFKIMVTLMQGHFSANAPDIKAYWTRSTDTFITLSDRAAYASKMGADIFVSLHMNCWTSSSVNGSEVYYSSSNNAASFSGITSKKMAQMFLTNVCAAMGTTNRGVSAQKYTVVHKNTVPAVLIELGFLSGSSDFKKLSNSTYQQKAADTIFTTIQQIFTTYPTGR